MSKFDITILTDARYLLPKANDQFHNNVLLEDQLLKEQLELGGLCVDRQPWDAQVDWSDTMYAIFRTTWDYFDRFGAFDRWLTQIKNTTKLINDYHTIRWNLDKHYLGDLENKGIPIVPTQFIEIGDQRSLIELIEEAGYERCIIKPAISGAARHTYLVDKNNIAKVAPIYNELITQEAMLVQEFQEEVLSKGELSLMVMGGKFTHAVLKKAKSGDFRVQDDFGGSVHDYQADKNEIKWAESLVAECNPLPAYARVDIIWNKGQMLLSELELIEPELWFRKQPEAAKQLSKYIFQCYFA